LVIISKITVCLNKGYSYDKYVYFLQYSIFVYAIYEILAITFIYREFNLI
jgi:hypothetical protein